MTRILFISAAHKPQPDTKKQNNTNKPSKKLSLPATKSKLLPLEKEEKHAHSHSNPPRKKKTTRPTPPFPPRGTVGGQHSQLRENPHAPTGGVCPTQNTQNTQNGTYAKTHRRTKERKASVHLTAKR
jgi:hypothetical protein